MEQLPLIYQYDLLGLYCQLFPDIDSARCAMQRRRAIEQFAEREGFSLT